MMPSSGGEGGGAHSSLAQKEYKTGKVVFAYNGSYVPCGRPTAATYTPTEVMVLPLGYSGSVGCTCRTLYGVVGYHPEKLLVL